MTVLTNKMRDQIVSNARATFDEKFAELSTIEQSLAFLAWDSVVPDSVKKALRGVPARWLQHTETLHLNVRGMTIALRTKEGGLPIPYQGKKSTFRLYDNSAIDAVKDDTLADISYAITVRILRHAAAVEDLKKKRDEAALLVKSLLASVSTLKKLQEVWPDGLPLYETFLKVNAAPSVPMVQVTVVNQALGLPR